jgi:hypothetical protein
MADGALRGTRLGTTSYETDQGVEFAPRQLTSYDCALGHTTTLPFSLEAEIPYFWECAECGGEARLRGGTEPESKPERHIRTHWDMLLERRSLTELEDVLAERLAVLRERTGSTLPVDLGRRTA